ncbi:hypothetical protein FAI41_06785 [Acetobacteraceae bacterium]|nr:hypothetical protein FAI41_06785 [Acetobacteraceae bacterium]
MRHRFKRNILKTYVFLIFGTFSLAGCMGVGHELMKPDVTGYANAITDTQKQQLLHAMLMRRYGSLPTFVNVTQIISGHSAEQTAQLSIGGTAADIKLKTKTTGLKKNRTIVSDNGPAFTGKLGYGFTDKSTVTYQPILGQKYITNLVRPMPVATVMPLFSGGMPIDVLLRLTARWIDEMSNLRGGFGAGSVRFYLLLEDLRKLQEVGAISVAITDQEKETAKCFLVFTPTSEPEIETLQKEVKRMLHLSPDAKEAEIIRAAKPDMPGQIAILTNSALSMLAQISYSIEVPKADVDAGLTIATIDERGVTKRPLIIIRSGFFAPYDAYTSLRFRGRSYWIEDKDFESKQAFNMLKVLCNLATTDESSFLGGKSGKSRKPRLPVTTVSKSSGKISIKAPSSED